MKDGWILLSNIETADMEVSIQSGLSTNISVFLLVSELRLQTRKS